MTKGDGYMLYTTTNHDLMDKEDISTYFGKGITFADIVLKSIYEVCGGIQIGSRTQAIRYTDLMWWLDEFNSVEIDWQRRCLKDIKQAKQIRKDN